RFHSSALRPVDNGYGPAVYLLHPDQPILPQTEFRRKAFPVRRNRLGVITDAVTEVEGIIRWPGNASRTRGHNTSDPHGHSSRSQRNCPAPLQYSAARGFYRRMNGGTST